MYQPPSLPFFAFGYAAGGVALDGAALVDAGGVVLGVVDAVGNLGGVEGC